MLKALLSPFADKVYAVLRMFSGLILTLAGGQKLLYMRETMTTQLWVGAILEVLLGPAILLGPASSPAARRSPAAA
jgi:hypothetical protein